jgi:AraC family cel operon transcriptional repressor
MKGSISHFINNNLIALETGHMVFIRPRDIHNFYYREGDCQFINLAMLSRVVDQLFAFFGEGFDKSRLLEPKMPPMFLLSNYELSHISAQFEWLNTIPVNDKLRLNIELRCILTNLITRYFINRLEIDNKFPDWLNHVIDEMQKPVNFRDGIEAIKRIACKSEEHICRSFKKHLNTTPTRFVNELKLNYTANQLRFSNKKIFDIAFDAGFENQSNFHRQFKSIYKTTPAEFRKTNLRDMVYNH